MSTKRTIQALPLTAERFAQYGDVIEASPAHREAMNSARFERFQDLAQVQIDDSGRPAISIARCREATRFPYTIDMLERHPLGSQAFVPMTEFRFIVAVAPAGPLTDATTIEAFISNGHQGINYHTGTWHMPMVALEAGQEFLIVDRAGPGGNCDEHVLDAPVQVNL